eukprot:14229906-Alexandrium_andersonii.AAC.1
MGELRPAPPSTPRHSLLRFGTARGWEPTMAGPDPRARRSIPPPPPSTPLPSLLQFDPAGGREPAVAGPDPRARRRRSGAPWPAW